jgi:uncharacterized membrane protein YphA (DoxX/SURF4 family)
VPLSTLARIGLAVLWLYTGVSKASDMWQTKEAVAAYKLLPDGAVGWFAAALPAVEIGLGLLLLIGFGTRLWAICSALMLVMFISAIISVWSRGLNIDCGCFGGGGYDPSSGPRQYAEEIGRDLVFLAASIWLAARPRSWVALGPGSRATFNVRAALDERER